MSGYLQLLGYEKRFHTAWVKCGPDGPETPLPDCPEEQTSSGSVGMSQKCQNRKPRPQLQCPMTFRDMEPGKQSLPGDAQAA